jgi:hypothetical protein
MSHCICNSIALYKLDLHVAKFLPSWFEKRKKKHALRGTMVSSNCIESSYETSTTNIKTLTISSQFENREAERLCNVLISVFF